MNAPDDTPEHRPVLIVDDNRDVRDACAEMLRAEGLEVVTATNGSEALTYLREHDASLVVLDMKMPVIDGTSFIQLLRSEARQNPRLGNIPIVVVTATRPTLLPEDVRVMHKPCDFGRLIELARDYYAS